MPTKGSCRPHAAPFLQLWSWRPRKSTHIAGVYFLPSINLRGESPRKGLHDSQGGEAKKKGRAMAFTTWSQAKHPRPTGFPELRRHGPGPHRGQRPLLPQHHAQHCAEGRQRERRHGGRALFREPKASAKPGLLSSLARRGRILGKLHAGILSQF